MIINEGKLKKTKKLRIFFPTELNALKEENMNLRNQLTCKICLEEKVAIGLSPCGHLACCETCAPTVIECPVCQEFVTNFFKAMLVRQKNRRC